MKLSNLFKKTTQTVAIANVEKLEKQQLEKVIGGIDTIAETNETTEVSKTASDMAAKIIGNIRA
ncbi:MAG: hypothetical protein V4565_05020 [Bacteroidota bacterium]